MCSYDHAIQVAATRAGMAEVDTMAALLSAWKTPEQ